MRRIKKEAVFLKKTLEEFRGKLEILQQNARSVLNR